MSVGKPVSSKKCLNELACARWRLFVGAKWERALGKCPRCARLLLDSQDKSAVIVIKKGLGSYNIPVYCSLITSSQRRYSEIIAHGIPISRGAFAEPSEQSQTEGSFLMWEYCLARKAATPLNLLSSSDRTFLPRGGTACELSISEKSPPPCISIGNFFIALQYLN